MKWRDCKSFLTKQDLNKPDDRRQFERGKFVVRNRSELGEIKPEAQALEGRAFVFEAGWIIDEGNLYLGEWAMLPRDDSYPLNTAPAWIASGDLQQL